MADRWAPLRTPTGIPEREALVAVSFEESGVHLIIEGLGSVAEADRMVEAISAQLQRFSGRVVHLVPL